MNLYVGTSGFAYKPWKGPFYPKDLHDDEMLRYYGTQFRTVEINNTFYRMPKTTVLESWASEVPADFRFVLKASRRITHIKRLQEADEPLAYLVKAARALGERLGCLLFQLPPNLKKDTERLRAFIALMPIDVRAAIEFRHQSWLDDETFGVLREHGAALCIAEAEDGVEVPFVSTTDWGYLRLRMPEYTDANLEAFLDQVAAKAWRDTFVFFKHEEAGAGPALARRFLELAG